MIKVIFKYENKEVAIDANPGETIMEAAQKANIPLVSGCGGAGVCGSCLVDIAPEWIKKLNEPEPTEQDLLECLPMYKSNSRLACQIPLTESLNGIIVFVK